MEKTRTRCMGCQAPIQFQPGAGSRLCPFCGHINLVREQLVAAPTLELKTDEVFKLMQAGELEKALKLAESVSDDESQNFRLAFYRACILFDMEQVTEAVYTLIDLTGVDAPRHLRADIHAQLAEALFAADRIEEALESADRSLSLQENHPGAKTTRAKIFMEQGKLSKAAKVLEETIPALSKRWKITFPPQPSSLLMLLARVYMRDKRYHKAIVPLESILFHDSATPLDRIAQAIGMLGIIYIKTRGDLEQGMTLIRHAALLDPENKLGLLDTLAEQSKKANIEADEEIQTFKEKKNEGLSEIAEVFKLVDGFPAGRVQLVPETNLVSLNSDPDRRTDLMESAAIRLGLKHFDRGTLYPLSTMEDFRRWVVAWRVRDYIRKMKHEELEQERLTKLKAARDVEKTRASYHRQTKRLGEKRRARKRRALRIMILSLFGLMALVLVALAMFGDRFLDEFEGRLIKIDCRGKNDGPPCTLYIDAGAEGRARYRERTASDSFVAGLMSSWLDQRVQKDGTILYPLDFPWGNIAAEEYLPCVGKRVRKERFSFSPECVR